MALEDRGDYAYVMQAMEEAAEAKPPEFESSKTSEEDQLRLLLAQRQESLKVEREEAALGVLGAEKRVKRLEKMVASLEEKITAMVD